MKKISILFLSALLSGCIAVVAAGAAGGLIVYDKRSVVMIEKDARIFHVVHKTIVTNPKFNDSHIDVTSFNQVVLLTGQTPAASLKVLAEKIARQTPNVERVYNEITIGYPTSLSQRSQDTWITSQVRTQMLTKKGLESGSIRVVTENSVVYLMGIVTHKQANLAVDVARQVNGVTKVVKVFRYIT
ncbi:BON domain-containing protein [Legionella impletisoli]|uniref:BON domain-containing protein n=1 Tax=Legionella impletisoli TaxID=343510 RepID=A0A917NDB8_9GAMM|nr:BON domain-containing protein [Legionella impletisoli]GGI86698.1 BON domain-containing protein [Legionella impletisoli]